MQLPLRHPTVLDLALAAPHLTQASHPRHFPQVCTDRTCAASQRQQTKPHAASDRVLPCRYHNPPDASWRHFLQTPTKRTRMHGLDTFKAYPHSAQLSSLWPPAVQAKELHSHQQQHTRSTNPLVHGPTGGRCGAKHAPIILSHHTTTPKLHPTRTPEKQQARCSDSEHVAATQHKMPQGGPLCLTPAAISHPVETKLYNSHTDAITQSRPRHPTPDGVPAWRPSCLPPHNTLPCSLPKPGSFAQQSHSPFSL